MAGLDWLTARPIAHRGLHDTASGIIENSPSAVEAAIEGGYAVEVDLQSAEGLEPVVFHDFKLDRLAGETGPVAARRMDELRRIAYSGSDDRVMSLDDLLDLAAGRSPLVIEVKTDWSGTGDFARVIVDKLERYAGPIALMSFDPKFVSALRDYAPAVPRGIVAESMWAPDNRALGLATSIRHGYILHAYRTLPHFVAYDIRQLPALAPLALRTIFGLPLLTWTVRTPAERRKAKFLASQMIFEDFRP